MENKQNKLITHFIDQILIVIILLLYFLLENYIQENQIGAYLFNFNLYDPDANSMLIMGFIALRFLVVLFLPIYIVLRIILYIRKIKANKAAGIKVIFYVILLLFISMEFSIISTPGDAKRWMRNDSALQEEFMKGIKELIHVDLKKDSVNESSTIYSSGEWLFATYAMAGYGFGQVAMANPALKDSCMKEMTFCINRMLSKEVKEFDQASWEEDPLTNLGNDNGHVAYLGYLNLLLGMHRFLDKNSEFSNLNDSITKTLVRRYEKSKIGLLETYPGVTFPADNAPAIGSIGMYSKATNTDYSQFLQKWSDKFRNLYIDKETSLTYQWVEVVESSEDSANLGSLSSHMNHTIKDSIIYSLPRGSGTAACIYFLSFADTIFTKQLYHNLKNELATSVGIFGAIQEYPEKYANQSGDIDSGPVIFNLGISATGFAIAGAKCFKDKEFFRKMCSLAYFVGVPYKSGQKFQLTFGDKLGNAILFAMLTANIR